MNALERNFFSDPEIIQDPGTYYAALRQLGPVVREPHHGVFMVTGIEEILAVYADLDSFSSVVAQRNLGAPRERASQTSSSIGAPRFL